MFVSIFFYRYTQYGFASYLICTFPVKIGDIIFKLNLFIPCDRFETIMKIVIARNINKNMGEKLQIVMILNFTMNMFLI